MKKPAFLPPALVVLALLAPAVAQTANAPRAPVPPLEQPGDAAWEKLDTYRYEQRDKFEQAVRQIAAGLDKQIAALEPAGQTPAQTGRPRAILDLQAARRILDERMGRIELSIPENWDLIRAEVLTALAQVRTAYDKAAATAT